MSGLITYWELNQRKKAISLEKNLKRILDDDISFKFMRTDGRLEDSMPDYISFRKEDQELARLYWMETENYSMVLNVYADDFLDDYVSEIQEEFDCKVRYAGD